MIDIYHTRRGFFRDCKYWLPDKTKNRDEIILTQIPTGMFCAKEVNAITSGANPIGNVFASNKNTVVLETRDDVNDLVKDSIVLYLGKSWVVDNLQREIHTKETEFSDEIHATTYISIRR